MAQHFDRGKLLDSVAYRPPDGMRLELHTDDRGVELPAEHGFRVFGPTVRHRSLWTAGEGGRQLTREEAAELLGEDLVDLLLGGDE